MTKQHMKKLYLTSQIDDSTWHYIGDPLNPFTTLDTGIITCSRDEMRIDQFGAYVIRYIAN